MKGFLAVCAALATTSASVQQARADLRDVAGRVADAWVRAGADVTRAEPRFLLEDEATTLDLWPGKQGACWRVALIGARGMSFHVTTGAATDDTFRVASVAGVLELQGCSGGAPDHLTVKADSGRGALETVIATAPISLPPVRTIVLERTGGVIPAAPELGPLPMAKPPVERATDAESRMTRDGFGVLGRMALRAGEDGKGGETVRFEAGCHRVEIFAADMEKAGGRRPRLDLDGSLRRGEGELVALDQTAAPDVRLDACLGVASTVTLSFEGAPRGSPVVATHGHRPIPDTVPTFWGPDPRARFAAALLDHHVASPPFAPIAIAQGPSGETPVAVEVEPGACYVAIAVLEHGHGHGMGLHVTVAGRRSDDSRGSKVDGAVVAFCAAESRWAQVEVDARSTGSGWALAVFRMAGGAWSRPR